jgi:MFS family permease
MNPVVFSIFIDPMRNDMNAGLSTLAWVMSIRMLSGGLVTPVIGRLLDKYGARWVGSFGGFLAGLSLVGFYFAENLWSLYLFAFVGGLSGIGVAGGGGQLLTTLPVANWFIAKRGRAIAITSTGMGIGTTISAPVGLLLINTIGWRSTWLVFGLIIWLVVIPGYAIFMRRRPEDVGLLPDGLDSSVKDKYDIEPTKNMDQELNWTVKQALRTPILWLILLASSIYIFCTSAILFLRVPFWNEIGIPQGIIAFGIGIDPFTVIFAVLLFGFLAERFPIRFMALIGGSWRAMSMLPLILFGTHSYSVLLHNVIWGVGSGAFVIAQNLVIPTYFGRHSQGSIGGVILPLMIIAGASGAPIAGYLVDSGVNITTIWKTGTVLMLFSGLVFFFLKPPKLN